MICLAKRSRLLGLVVLAAGLMTVGSENIRLTSPQGLINPVTPPSSRGIDPAEHMRVGRSYGKLPLYFIRNEGQVDKQAAFYAKTRGYTLWFSASGMVFDKLIAEDRTERGLKSESFKRDVSRLEFVGADPDPVISGFDEQEHRINDFRGNDPSQWRTGIRSFAAVHYRSVYPRIDLRVYGVESRIEYDWEILPGGDPAAIRFKASGVQGTDITPDGDLHVRTAFGELTHRKPITYQEIDGKRIVVDARFKKTGSDEYGFEIGGFDRAYKLTIDPMVYSTYLGGSNRDYGDGITVDGSGNAYVAGHTASTNFPTTSGAIDSSANGYYDISISRLNAAGTGLDFSTYLGGINGEKPWSIALDGGGNIYVVGDTTSPDFPTTADAFDRINLGDRDVFLVKLNASGSALVYSTYLGGGKSDYLNRFTVDAGGNVYVTGETDSTDFPTTVGAFDRTFNGDFDVFITRLNAAGTGLDYSTYLGGSDTDTGYDIAVDAGGSAYVTGATSSTNFPTTAGVLAPAFIGGGVDAFVTRINASGTALVFSTYLGGGSIDDGYGIVLESGGNALATGFTSSTDFPVTAGAYDATSNGGYDIYITRLNAAGTALAYSTFLGGSDMEQVDDIALGNGGNIYLTGFTYSTNFPTTAGAYDTTHNGDRDAFIARFNAAGTALIYSTYLGGSGFDEGYSIAADGGGHAYVAGYTKSTDFPTTAGAFDTGFNGGEIDAFVAKLGTQEQKADFLGTWDGQGVYYRNSESGLWAYLATAASLITAGDIDHDETDDLIGIWPGQGGVWTRQSSNGQWVQLSSTALDIAAGDMNGDGRDDLLASWNSQGVFYRDSATGAWVQLATSASQVTCGDLDGDTKDDLIGIWPAQGGVWAKYSATNQWDCLSTTAVDISAGDMNGDGRDDLLATWSGQGVYYRDSLAGTWVQLATPATLVAAGDLDGDGKSDLIGIWPGQGGVWVKNSLSGSWANLSTTAAHIGAGFMRSANGGAGSPKTQASGDRFAIPGQGHYLDLSRNDPFYAPGESTPQDKLEPAMDPETLLKRTPGPGEKGFSFIKGDNLLPGGKLAEKSQPKGK